MKSTSHPLPLLLAAAAFLGCFCLWAPTVASANPLAPWRKPQEDAYLLLAMHFSQNGRSNLARDLIAQARVLRTSKPAGYRGDLHAKLHSSKTMHRLQGLIETLAAFEHPDALLEEGVSSADERNARVCASDNLERLRLLADSSRASYRFQMKHDHQQAGAFLLERPSSLTRTVRDSAQETRNRCLPALGARLLAQADELARDFGESLGALDAMARGELEREHARFADEQRACEMFELRKLEAARRAISRHPEELDEVALAELQGALAELHKRKTHGEPLERLERRSGKPAKLTRDDLEEYLRAYLLEPCRELTSDMSSGARALADASNILASEFILGITRHPMTPVSQLWLAPGDNLGELATWSLRYFTCERLVRVGEHELAKRLEQRQ